MLKFLHYLMLKMCLVQALQCQPALGEDFDGHVDVVPPVSCLLDHGLGAAPDLVPDLVPLLEIVHGIVLGVQESDREFIGLYLKRCFIH